MAEREIPGGTSNGGSTARSLTLSVLIWAGIILALFATAGLSGYFSMKRAVRGGEVAVPPLEGKPLSEASSTLARVGLVLEKSGERSDDRFASGKILAQDPPAGVKLKRNRKVRVVVSLGMEVLQVPNLVGQPARRAQIAVQQSGLRVGGVSYSRSNEVGADRVLAQEPPPGPSQPGGQCGGRGWWVEEPKEEGPCWLPPCSRRTSRAWESRSGAWRMPGRALFTWM